MKLISSISALSIMLFLSGCAKENLGDCFKSTGKSITEKRALAGFNKLYIDDQINVFIEEANEHSAEVAAGENLQDFIITEVRDGVLYIENDNRCNWVRSYKRAINVTVRSPEVNEITYYGSGKVECLNQIHPATFLLNAWEASGNITLDIASEDVELKLHTGPVNLNCKGTGDFVVVYNNGLGTLDSRDFKAREALAVNANSGELKVFADSILNANIEGNGDLFYSGEPKINLRITGNGKLIESE